jgi:hypothetical protein
VAKWFNINQKSLDDNAIHHISNNGEIDFYIKLSGFKAGDVLSIINYIKTWRSSMVIPNKPIKFNLVFNNIERNFDHVFQRKLKPQFNGQFNQNTSNHSSAQYLVGEDPSERYRRSRSNHSNYQVKLQENRFQSNDLSLSNSFRGQFDRNSKHFSSGVDQHFSKNLSIQSRSNFGDQYNQNEPVQIVNNSNRISHRKDKIENQHFSSGVDHSKTRCKSLDLRSNHGVQCNQNDLLQLNDDSSNSVNRTCSSSSQHLVRDGFRSNHIDSNYKVKLQENHFQSNDFGQFERNSENQRSSVPFSPGTWDENSHDSINSNSCLSIIKQEIDDLSQEQLNELKFSIKRILSTSFNSDNIQASEKKKKLKK